MLSIELLILVAMLGTFIVLLAVAKLPSGLSLMIASVVGWVLSWAIQGTSLDIRYLIEGGYGYIDNLLVIVAAMVFIGGLQASGGLEYISAILVKVFKNMPTLLLVMFMVLLLLPGMVTGSSTAGIVSAGAIVAPIMLKMGMPKKKVAAFVGMGAILGMVAPPINIPVMVICDVVDIPYSGFDLPLLILTVPCAIFACIFFSRDIKGENKKLEKASKLENLILTAFVALVEVIFAILFVRDLGANSAKIASDGFLNVTATAQSFWTLVGMTILLATIIFFIWKFKPYSAKIDMEKISGAINFNILKELKWYSIIPVIVIVLLFAAQSIFPKVVGVVATPLLFIIAFIPTMFTGRKIKPMAVVDDAVKKSLGVMGLLMGVGMFIEIMTLSGVRGYIVINVLSLLSVSKVLLFVALAVSMTVFGGVSSFASASVFGGPFVMVLLSGYSEIYVASACSLVAALGEFLPPTAMSARLSADNINMISDDKDEVKFMDITKVSAVPLAVTLIWAMLFIVEVAPKR